MPGWWSPLKVYLASCRGRLRVVGIAQLDTARGGERAACDSEPEAAREDTPTGETSALHQLLLACTDHHGREP